VQVSGQGGEHVGHKIIDDVAIAARKRGHHGLDLARVAPALQRERRQAQSSRPTLCKGFEAFDCRRREFKRQCMLQELEHFSMREAQVV
jgi:hypothetical protein